MSQGFAVGIRRKNGGWVYATAGNGIGPAIFARRIDAVNFRSELLAHRFAAFIVKVAFNKPRPIGRDAIRYGDPS